MASVGGLLGLTSGISLTSIAESIFFSSIGFLLARRILTNKRIDQMAHRGTGDEKATSVAN